MAGCVNTIIIIVEDLILAGNYFINYVTTIIAGEISSTVAHIMVPNPTKSIIAETQARLTDIIRELEKNLSRLIMLVGDKGMNASVERCIILTLGLIMYTRRQKKVTFLFCAVPSKWKCMPVPFNKKWKLNRS